MSIDSILSRAAFGAQKGLNDARNLSSQLAYGAPAPEEVDEEATAKVQKAADEDLGTIVDEQA